MTEAMTEESLFELLSLECRVDRVGTLRYYNAQGQLHRVHGPAVVRPNGGSEWWQNGRRHRLNAPAVIHADGYRAWYQNGQRHRADGPAAEWANGSKLWYINDKWLTEADWQRAVANMETV